ncbi:MAG: MBL fold metallo-hydrolase [Pseudomonadota bacterium]|nr:MBL fold metallo-hydrolase [Pseudomonadota bacterium]
MNTKNVWNVGDVKITRVAEFDDFALDPEFIFDIKPEAVKQHEWLLPHFITPAGEILVSIHAFVIEAGKRKIVVDTCIGNDKKRHTAMWNNLQGPFLDDLAAAGYPAQTIDTVVCTHLHVDHVGWNTRMEGGRWVPTFPNARYLFGRIEWDHWKHEMELEAAAATAADTHAAHLVETGTVMGDSVQPIITAGLHDLVEVNHQLADGVTLQHTPGHTPGHVCVRISSRGQHAVITGDLMHHPLQCSLPELGTHVDWNSSRGHQTRLSFFKELADTRVLVLGSHFAKPTAGWVVSDGERWRLSVDAPA